MSHNYQIILSKSFLIILAFFSIGLPINNIYNFSILLFCIPIIILSDISIHNKKINFILFLSTIFIFKSFIPVLKIQEENNLLLLNENTYNFYKENLPNEIFSFVENKFNFYNSKSECDKTYKNCWKNYNHNTEDLTFQLNNKIYAFSSDWSLSKIKYSRIVSDINFYNLKTARIGIINDLSTNFFRPSRNDIVRETIPFFVKYEIPKQLINSSICWEGNIFIQNINDSYSHIFNKEYSCKKFDSTHVNKNLYAISFGSNNSFEHLNYLYGDVLTDNIELRNFLTDNNLKIKLDKSAYLKITQIFEYILKIIFLFVLFIFLFNFKINNYVFSFFYLCSFILLLIYVDKDLISGFDIYLGGNDGITYMSYGNILFQHLLSLNFYEFFKGIETIFYYPSSLRYFWPINKIFFGETIYGYILIAYLFTFVLFYIFKNIFGIRWALGLSVIFFFTRLLEGYALSLYKMIKHINEGDAEPLAIFFFLTSFLIFVKLLKDKKNNLDILYPFIFGFTLFLSISLRPNYFPTALLLVLIFLTHSTFKSLSFSRSLSSILGFSFMLLIPFHNFFYANSYVLFSSASNYNTHAPIHVYYNSLIDIINLNIYNSEYIGTVKAQVNKWIKPNEIHYIITLFILIFTFFIKNNFFIKILSFLALSQHFVLLIYEPTGRYSYLAWILSVIVLINFFKALIDLLIFRFKKYKIIQ